MFRGLRWVAFATALLLSQASEVRAQITIDTRGLGWGGWGNGSGSGNQFVGPAEGGAQARAIDAQTAMNLNEYIFQSQMAANRRYAERQALRQKRVNETADAMMNRLRNNPSTSDIMKGDALNIAFDDITNPKAYAKTIKAGKATLFAGTKIKSIPFQYAAAAITTSLEDLTQPSTTPAILKGPEFKADLSALRTLQSEFKGKAEEMQTIPPAQITKARDYIKKMTKTLQGNPGKFRKGSAEFREAENYLKGLYTVVTMLESPSMTNLLSGVEKQEGTTVGDLIRFMHSANLRFGVAKLDEQREIYSELFGILDGLRGEVVGSGTNAEPPMLAKRPTQLGELFKGMEKLDFTQLDRLRILPPLPEELKKLLPPPPGTNRRPPPPLPFKP